jgi:CRP/FNR family transcriptional regulator, cyclic AMP receptor protein
MEASISIPLLDVDPDLAEGLAPDALAVARRHLVAPTHTIEPGLWGPEELHAAHARPSIGFYVVEGMLTREIHFAGRSAAELLGAGDLIRPWGQDPGVSSVPLESRWHVLDRATIAVLDGQVTTVIGRFPTIVDALVGRMAEGTRALAFQLALSQITRVEARLIALLWHLGERWGRVRPDGILLGLRLTHETLAKLVGARRPSVTTAMTALSRRGWVQRTDAGWLLHGDAGEQIAELMNGSAASLRRVTATG